MAKKAVLHGPVVDDQKQAEGALAEMAALERKMIQADLEAREICDEAKARANESKTPLEARYKELEAALKKWATMNKSALFAERKTLDLAFGVIGFRAVTIIKQINKVTEAETLAKLQQLGFRDAIRVIEEVNKEAMEGWPDERLTLVGCERRTTDKWQCQPKQENINSK
jgi:phage host-nuclease inhibitor protein Gam